MRSSELAQTIRLMIDAGCSTEQIKLVCDAHANREDARRAEQRDRWREVKQKQRLSKVSTKTRVDIVDLSPSSSPSDGFPPPLYSNTIHPPSLTPSTPPSHTRLREAFDRFWKLYPKRTGKGAAEKAWAKSAARLDPEVILSAVAIYPWPEDPQFIPHPATWLNQKRWEDEPSNVTAFTPKAKERDLRNIPDNLLGNDDYWKKRRQQKEGLR